MIFPETFILLITEMSIPLVFSLTYTSQSSLVILLSAPDIL